MKNLTRSIVLSLIIGILTLPAFSQPLKEKVNRENIRTVKMHKMNEPLSPPVIRLNSEEKVTLSFDDMDGGTKNFSYKIIHCHAGWKPSDLFESDYLSGQFTSEIYNSHSSFNTLRQYTHYELNIPNENMKPVSSGNYMLMVYANNNPQDTVLTRKFRVSEKIIGIKGETESVNRMSRNKPNQELNLSLQTGNIQLNNPNNNLKIAVQKNYHNEKLYESLNPSSMNGNRISYEMNEKLVFKGGNEFHHFNTKTTDYAGAHIKKINFEQNNFHFLLETDKDRNFQQYKNNKDLNGRFQIDSENSENPDTEADYVYVYFTLKTEHSAAGGKFYVTGAFNNWNCEPENRMIFNNERKVFEKRLLLKQGYHDYKYTFKSNEEEVKPFYISGNHYQTENDYMVYIYYTDYKKGYDRLIGHTLINSSEKAY
ncbi:MAG: type IX secretion system plug protein domain-containing protein [Bacteroidales bacterium]|nr:DUF5103 domain-containing protein [Bacteroidales bacterium]